MVPECDPTFTASTAPLMLVFPATTLIPVLAVISPTESTLVTSSYVSVPPTETAPVNVAATPVMLLIVISGVPVSPAAVYQEHFLLLMVLC